MNRRNIRNLYLNLSKAVAAAILIIVMTAVAAHAQDTWKFDFTPYMWATDVGVNVKLDGHEVVDKQISVSDLLKDIDTIFQGQFSVQHGSIGVMTDLFDVNLSDNATGVSLPENKGTADIAMDSGMTILDVAGFYDRKADREGFVLLGGVRFLDERTTVNATLNPAGGPVIPKTYQTSDWITDGLLGGRYQRHFTPRWGMNLQADASTGGTDHTWSASSLLSYNFGKNSRFGINGGYRYMDVHFKEENGIQTRMTMSGPLFGFRMSF